MKRPDDDRTWRALADPARRAILDLLRDGPRRTGELCAAFEVSRFAVMKHLTVLERAGLVIVRREGRVRWNYLNPAPLQAIHERWMTPYMELWSHHLLDLKRTVEHREEKRSATRHGNSREAPATRL
jgi:DNA-binding transcriptional ArsR family regulator